jgi:hypothetical protein
VQLAAPTPLIEFASQASQEKLSVVRPFFPASQLWQEPSLDQNCTMAQVLQSSELSWSPAEFPTVKLPSAQSVQNAVPVTSVYLFGWHTAQSGAEFDPWALYVPTTQFKQPVRPSLE